MAKKMFVVKTKTDLERCFLVMKELRPHLDLESYFSIYEDAHKNEGYEILAVEDDAKVLALMGYRLTTDFVRGRHLYIDDLVTTESLRSSGLGAELLQHAERIAADLGCKILRLCTGLENERGIRFYEKYGWSRRSYAYVKKLG